jgi:S-adenosylmethionine synthetase
MSENVDLNQLTNLTAQQRAGTQGLLASQNTASADYLKRYTDFINSQEGASAMSQRIGQELGLPTLQANATNLRNTLTNIPSTYTAASRGYDINQNQLSRIIGQKSSELSPLVTTAENSLQNAQSNLNTQMGYEQTDQAKALKPYETEQTMLSDRLARETTLYSQDNQNELNALIAKINAGVSLNNAEASRAQELAVQEKSYQQAKETATANPNTQIIESNGKKYLINSATGQVIQTYGTSGGGNTTASYFTQGGMGSSGGKSVANTATSTFKANPQ